MSQMPPTLGYATPQPPDNLRIIATRQRAIILCILGEIILVVVRMVAANSGVPLIAIVSSFLYLAVAITGAVFLFMLAMALYNTGAGIVLGILSLIPLLGLILLLIMNGRATNLLRAGGVKVGFLGADMSTLPNA